VREGAGKVSCASSVPAHQNSLCTAHLKFSIGFPTGARRLFTALLVPCVPPKAKCQKYRAHSGRYKKSAVPSYLIAPIAWVQSPPS
jgi:hypothetical protein